MSSRPAAPPQVPQTPPASPVPSPCTNICRMNPATGWCEGCWRTLDEIAAWSTLSEAAKRDVWQALDARRAQHARESS